MYLTTILGKTAPGCVGISANYLRSKFGKHRLSLGTFAYFSALGYGIKSATYFQTCVAKLLKCVAFGYAIHTNSNARLS